MEILNLRNIEIVVYIRVIFTKTVKDGVMRFLELIDVLFVIDMKQ